VQHPVANLKQQLEAIVAMTELNQETVDTALWRAMSERWGCYTALAKIWGEDKSNVSRRFSPHEPEYRNFVFEFLDKLSDVATVNPALAADFLQIANSFAVPMVGQAPTHEGHDVLEEIGVIVARLQNPNTPTAEQLPLKVRLLRLAQSVESGERFMDREDAPEEAERMPRRVAVG
jgi:hypothetical protein